MLETIRVTAEIERGSKNAGKFIVLHVESAKPAQAAKPAAPQGAQQQPKPTGAQPDAAKT